MGFFEAAARRSKRGYRGKLHRCNGAGEAAKVLSRDLGGLAFAQDANGNWGFKIGGADPVIPFKGEMDFDYEHNISIPYIVVAGNPNVLHYYTMTEEDAAYSYLALFAVTAGSVVSIELSGVSGPSIVCNKPGGNYSFALIANPVLNGKVNFRHGGTGDGHVFKLMPVEWQEDYNTTVKVWKTIKNYLIQMYHLKKAFRQEDKLRK